MASFSRCMLTVFSRELCASLYEEFCALDQRIQTMEERIQRVFRNNAQCQKITAVGGLGVAEESLTLDKLPEAYPNERAITRISY